MATSIVNFWPESSSLLIKDYTSQQCRTYLDQVLAQANQTLQADRVEVVYFYHQPVHPPVDGIDPLRNLMLGIRTEYGQEPIDILDLKALDASSLKPMDVLVAEVTAKVRQHVAAKETDGIWISISGSKLDARCVEDYDISIDLEGYLYLDESQVVYNGSEFEARKLHSYSILRLFVDEDEEKMMIVDDYDMLRKNNVAMAIDLSVKVHQSFQLVRFAFTEGLKQRCLTQLSKISYP